MPDISRSTTTPVAPEGDERGATAVEYGLMVALIAVAIAASVTLFGQQVVALFELIPPAIWGN